MRVCLKRLDKVRSWYQGGNSGEVFVEEGRDRGRIPFQLGDLTAGYEEGAGERAVLERTLVIVMIPKFVFVSGEKKSYITRDGNEHEVLAGPDVQVVRRNSELGIGIFLILILVHGARGQVEFAPQSVDVLLLVIHSSKLH